VKVVRLSALQNGRLYLSRYTRGTRFFWRLSRAQSHNGAGRIMPMNISNDTIGNRTRDLPACRAVPQPTALPTLDVTCSNTQIHFCELVLLTKHTEVYTVQYTITHNLTITKF